MPFNDSTKARFKVVSAFPLKGRGFVLAGDIIEGKIKPGMRIVLPTRHALGESSVIKSVELINVRKPFPNLVGLIVDCKDDTEQSMWNEFAQQASTFDIED